MKIFIDSGHNFSGADTGAIGNGLKEQDITFMIADKLKRLFLDSGHSVKMSRNSLEENIGKTVSDSLNKRTAMSNEWGADLFISIHCNAGGGTGTETLVYSKGGESEKVAERIQNAICRKLGTIDRGVKVNSSLAVLRLTKAPAVLVETAFIDNIKDSVLLRERQGDFASAIYEGVAGKMAEINELTEVNDICWELGRRNIITDKELWLKKLKEDKNSYYLARKALNYMRGKNV